MHCPRSSSGCSSMQGICAWFTREDLCFIALCYANIFGIVVFNASMLDWLRGSIFLLYICIVIDLAVGVAVCKASVLDGPGRATWSVTVFKASMLDWLVGPSVFYIYMHCPRSSSGCSGMQGICAQVTGEDLCLIALCYANIFGAAVFNASMLDWLRGSICLLYICIVLDLAVGVAVCKASVLDSPGRTYASLHCAMLIYLV